MCVSVVMEQKKKVEAAEVAEPVRNTSGYYVDPSTAAAPIPTKSHASHVEWEDHRYHNDTLDGKASLLYDVGERDGREA